MLPIAGYTEQSDMNVEVVNVNKQVEEYVLRMLDQMANNFENALVCDQYWVAIAKTHIEQGFMAMNRAVFQPKRIKITTTFTIEADK